MNIVLYNFSKKKNSTKRPDGGTTASCQLKEATSILNPTFILSFNPQNYNYVTVNTWGRYYFIDDIRYLGAVWEIDCSCDELATFKSDISNYTCFIERSASSYDSLVNDPTLSMQQSIVNKTKVNTNISEFSSSGCFLIRTIAKNSNSVTGVNTYTMTKGQMSNFINDAFNVGSYGDVFTEVVDELVKAVFNPFDYVASVSWVPFSATTFAGNSTTSKIRLGWWDCPNAVGYPVTKQAMGIVLSVTKPSLYFNDFRDFNPNFTKATMWIPGVGIIDLDPRELRTSSNLYVMYFIDSATGEASVYLRSGASASDSQSIASYQANLNAPVQLSQTSLNISGVASSLVSTVGGVTSGDIPQASVSGVTTLLDVIKPTTNSIGSQGNVASIIAYMDIYIELTHYGSKDFPNTVGRPCCKNLSIGSLSGYVKCGNASITISGFESEKDTINSFLNSGFYME